LLRVPYNLLNRWNRNAIERGTQGLSGRIRSNDFYLARADDDCLDFFHVMRKE
jgi:hypothetical protein